ncbi:MAG TPA: VOC family protein [Longimicrobiales bacterium]|nr:VOC family protein [Longimicrobiales bacterium]
MADQTPPIGGVHEAALYVFDLARAERFWRRLGFPIVARMEGRHVFFRAGIDMLLVFDPRATVQSDSGVRVPSHGAVGASHVALDVPDRDALERWRGHLAAAGVEIERELDWPSGGRSIYFRDPDGNSIELITRGTWGF